MIVASLTFSAADWTWATLVAAVVLVPLAWRALAPASPHRRDLAAGLGLRVLGIGLLLLCLLEPQWTASRPKPGANRLAILADNSQGLQITDPGRAQSRGAELRDLLEPAGLWGDLAATYQLRRYRFGEALRRVGDFSGLDFTDHQTALGSALRAVRERFAGEPLAGVVVFTDGNATDLPDGLGALDELPPVFPVVLGQSAGLQDAGIERIALRQTPFDDAPVSLRVEVAQEGLDGGPVTVALRPLDEKNRGDVPPPRVLRPGANNGAASAEFNWRPTGRGLQFHEVTVTTADPEREATLVNNRRLVMIDRGREHYRILYVGGRPNWEFKFLNRALAEDPQLQLVGLLRLALREPKFEFRGRAGEASNPLFRGFSGADDTTRYDQPVLTRLNTRDETELRGGFPRQAAELFAYDALILDDVEAGFFSPEQQLLLRRFVSERGGGLLMLGGVNSLENGGYGETALAPALPVHLDRAAQPRPPQGGLTWRLTREGWLEPWARVRAAEADERARLEQVPRLLIANALSSVKPGATVLATLEDETGETYPALVSQPFGHGRVAVVGAGDLWRWGMQGADEQADLARFWRQLSRWLVTDAPSRVAVQVQRTDASQVRLRVTVRDEEFRPVDLPNVRLTVRRADAPPDAEGFRQAVLPAAPDPETPGRYLVDFQPRDAGAYVVEAEVQQRTGEALGRARAAWVHEPAAEEFAALAPNRALLEELARRTGGAVLEPRELSELGERLDRTAAPVMEVRSDPLWHNPWVLAVVLGCFASEWFWRRWRGLP